MRNRLIKAFYSFILLAIGTSLTSHAQEVSVFARMEQDLKRLIDKVKPSVVTVSARRVATVNDIGESFFSLQTRLRGPYIDVINIGSGIVLDSIHILTHAGIVLNSDSIDITFSDSRHSRGRLVGVDQETGLAVLQTRHGSLKPALLRLNEPLTAGCTVALVGNSLGVSSAISLGIVNGVREDGIIQISTSIAAGNAGSPLFDHQGRLAGILAGRVSPIGDDYVLNEGFAVSEAALAFPVAEVVQRLRQLIYSTTSEQGWIGVSAEDWPGGMGWVHISDVKIDGPAHKAGLQIGDIVFSSDKRAMKGSRTLAQLVRKSKPGQNINFGVLRGDSTFNVTLLVGIETPTTNNKSAFSSFSTVSNSPPSRSSIDGNAASRPAALQQDIMLQRIHSLEQELSELRSLLKNNRP